VAFRVRFSRLVTAQIAAWQLSDAVLEEVDRHLRDDLAQDPAQVLIRRTRPFDGMCYIFETPDPDVRGREHTFVFHVLYSQDEEQILVARGAYHRRDE